MLSSFLRNLKKFFTGLPVLGPLVRKLSLVPHGPRGIRKVGHRGYIGGMWEEIGKLQFDFLVAQGLRPEHVFVDVACGSLRAGVHLVPYLAEGHYLGIEKEAELVQAGISQELGQELTDKKKPEFVISSAFEFEKFSRRPDYGIAQSLFTHLPPPIIHECFAKLRPFMNPDGRFYATYFESHSPVENPDKPHDQDVFAYTRAQMEEFGEKNGWKAEYIGDWKHPRKQVVVCYRPA